MKRSWKIILLVMLVCVGATASAQTPESLVGANARQLHLPPEAQHLRSPLYQYLASDEGRAWMQVTGNPRSKYLNQRYGAPSAGALAQAQARFRQIDSEPQVPEAESASTSPCNGGAGARFNLEPRANALPQFNASADFILNGAGSGADLIVQTANDARGNVTTDHWDGSLSGYYVHTSNTADCSVQFEGGLPSFDGSLGVGESVIAADPVRGVFYAADNRFPTGVGLFRTSAADLLNPKKCPNGTHTEKQAESCWMQTAPVLLDPAYDSNTELGIATDQRSSGKGAGDVYVVGGAQNVFIVACTTLLNCSSMENLDITDNYNAPFVQVRSDGVITISYMQQIKGQAFNQLIEFVTCTPAGAPNPPVCGQPTTVATVPALLLAIGQPPTVAPLGFSFTQHVDRLESDKRFTTFLVYDDCTNLYTPPPPPNDPPTYCLATRVHMTFSTDNGKTWSTPVLLDDHDGYHVFPTIANDASTGTVSIAHYSTEGNYFEHKVRVILNQISPGTTSPGPPSPVTSFAMTVDTPAVGFQIVAGFHLYMGLVAHGTGSTGQSHLYLSFDSEAVQGTYNGKPLPEGNNQIKMISY